MEDIIRIIQKDEFWVPWGDLIFKMKKCYDRENASSDINECLKLYYEHELSADSFSEGTL